MDQRLLAYKTIVEAYLASLFTDTAAPHGKLFEAMRYSLLAGGKRIRPALTLEFCRVCGGEPAKILPVAAAVEMVHTYSLIHDDLPSMDNDDLRRGKPSNHKAFGESTAILAGDALQAEAFSQILTAPLPGEVRARCAGILAQAAGASGICGGQLLDLSGPGEARTEEQLMNIHSRKTAAMIKAACAMGVAAAEGSRGQLEAALVFAENVGLAFQIRDDILDAIGTREDLGKPCGSDARHLKQTFMSLYGEARCQQLVNELTEKAVEAVIEAFDEPDFLCDLARGLAARGN